MALKLYQATGRRTYLEKGIALYEWTRRRLYDRKERLYSDHVNLDGSIGRAKFAYNSGQMLQAACLLYAATGEQDYLLQADTLAQACGICLPADLASGDDPDPPAVFHCRLAAGRTVYNLYRSGWNADCI